MNLSEMKRRREDKEDDPFTAQSYQHAQSELACIAGKDGNRPIKCNNIPCTHCILLFQENKSFGVRTICIHPLM